jgi:hypothetical protein
MAPSRAPGWILSSHRETRRERRVKQSRRATAHEIPATQTKFYIGSRPRRELAGGGNGERERDHDSRLTREPVKGKRELPASGPGTFHLPHFFFCVVDGNAEVLDQQL